MSSERETELEAECAAKNKRIASLEKLLAVQAGAMSQLNSIIDELTDEVRAAIVRKDIHVSPKMEGKMLPTQDDREEFRRRVEKSKRRHRTRLVLMAVMWVLVGLLIGKAIEQAWSYDYVDKRGWRHWNHYHDRGKGRHALLTIEGLPRHVRPGYKRFQDDMPRLAESPLLFDWSSGRAVRPACCKELP